MQRAARVAMLGCVAAAAAFAATSLGASVGFGGQPQAKPLAWLTDELGAPTDRGTWGDVALDRTGFRVGTGDSRIDLTTSLAGLWRVHDHGASRTTWFGSETVTTTPAKTELYDTVERHQGRRTWRWHIETALAPRPLGDGSIFFAGRHPMQLAPVELFDAHGGRITPAGARWRLEAASSGWDVTLDLDDSTLPLPYVVDPAFSSAIKPSPLLNTLFSLGATGIWALGNYSAAGTAPNLVSGAGSNGGDGTYAATGAASAASLVNDPDAAVVFSGTGSATDNNVAIPTVTTPKSVVLWVKSSSPGASPGGTLFSNRNGVSGDVLDIGLDSGHVFAYINTPGAYWTSSQTVNDGAVHQVAWTNDGTNGCLYIDGLPAEKSGSPGTVCVAQTFPASPATTTAYVGLEVAPTAGSPFSGTIDNVAIFNTALTANQVAQIYNAGQQFGLTLTAGTNTYAAPAPAAGATSGANGAIPATGPRLFFKSGSAGTFTVAENTGDTNSTAVTSTGTVAGLTQPGAFTGTNPSWTSGTYTIGSTLAAATPQVQITNPNGTSTATFTLTPDATAPTGGALTVNGTVATSGGSTSTTTSTSFPIDVRTNFAEAASATESGLASSTLVRTRYPFANNACNLGGGATETVTVTGTTNTGIAGGNCYVYTLSASDNVGNSATSLSTTVRVIGAASQLALSAPASIAQSTPFSVTVTAKDASGNTATGYTGTIHFTSSDSGATKPADYTFLSGDAGVHTFTNGFALVTGGSQSITATDTVTASITGSTNVTVTTTDGVGTISPNVSSFAAGATASVTFTYTADSAGMTNGAISIALPAGWTAPAASGAGAVTTTSGGTVGVSGQTATVSGINLAANATTTITYSNGVVGATTGSVTFQTKEKSTSGGTLTDLAAQPGGTVYAADGAGSLGTVTSHVSAGQSGLQIAFTYTAATGGMSNGAVALTVPAGWTAPQTTTPGAAGYVTSTVGTASVSSRTITVSGVTRTAGQSFTIDYGGAAGATAPATTGAATWQAQDKSLSGGTLTNTAASPSITVNAADGAGSFGTPSVNGGGATAERSATGRTVVFTFTAPAGGFDNGAVTLVVPTGWSAPSTTGSAKGYTTASSGTVSASGQTITVSGLTLAAGATTTITYGATGGGGAGADAPTTNPAPGSQTWTAQSRATTGGTLAALGTSPAVAVNDSTAPTVTNVTSTTLDGTVGSGQAIDVSVTFSEPVNVTGTPQLALNTNVSRSAAYASGSGGSTLHFTYTTQAGDSSSRLDYQNTAALTLAGGTIADLSGNAGTLTLPSPGAAGSLGANKNIVVDCIAPAFASAATNVSGQTVVTLNEALKIGQTLQPTDFTIKYNGTTQTINTVGYTGSTITLTPAASPNNSETVTVGYTKPGTAANQIQDAAGNATASFADQATTNNTPDTTAPTFVSASVNGSTLTLTYSETLDTNNPTASAFTVRIGGVSQTPTNVSVSGRTVVLTLSPAAANGDTVTVSLNNAGATNQVRDSSANHNAAANLTNQAVTNNTTPPTSPGGGTGGGGGTPPPPPATSNLAFAGAEPSDGSTVASATGVALHATGAKGTVTWSGMSLSFVPQGSSVETTTSLPTGTGTDPTYTFSATAAGLYVISGNVSDGVKTVTLRTHYTVFQASSGGGGTTQADPPPSAKTVSNGGGGTLTASTGSQAVTWTPASIPSDASEIRVDPTIVNTPISSGFQVGATTVNVTLVTATGSLIHSLPAPIEITFDTTDATAVPLTSDDNVTWRPILPVGSDHVLADARNDGYWIESLAGGKFRLHILTRHLTLFTILKDTQAPAAPDNIGGTIDGSGTLTLKWNAAVDNSGQISAYTIAADGTAIATVPGSQTSFTIPGFSATDERVFQVLAKDPAGNVGTLSAGATQVPNVVGMTLQAATAKIQQRGFTLGTVSTLTQAAGATPTVVEQSPVPPAILRVGGSIDLKVSAATGRAQLRVFVYGARAVWFAGKRELRLRFKLTLPVQLSVYLYDLQGKRYARWTVPVVRSGLRHPRFVMPANVILKPGYRYHVRAYFRAATGQRVIRQIRVLH